MVEIKNYLIKINQLKGLMEPSGLEPLTPCMPCMKILKSLVISTDLEEEEKHLE